MSQLHIPHMGTSMLISTVCWDDAVCVHMHMHGQCTVFFLVLWLCDRVMKNLSLQHVPGNGAKVRTWRPQLKLAGRSYCLWLRLCKARNLVGISRLPQQQQNSGNCSHMGPRVEFESNLRLKGICQDACSQATEKRNTLALHCKYGS